MKLCWCTIAVNDMDESVRFYHEIAGLEVERRFAAGQGIEIAFLGSGETKVELIYNGKRKLPISEDISLGFEVKSVDEMMDFVKGKGLMIHSGPFAPNPHMRFFYVLDPNGVKIQFVENI